MKHHNITQDTYTRIADRLENGARQTTLDVGDLLEAYESACLLLDKLVERHGDTDSEEFLYTDTGYPRVDLWSE